MIIVKEIIIKTPILGFLRFMDASLLQSGRGSELHGRDVSFRAPALIFYQAGLSTFRPMPETVSLKHPPPL